MFDNVNKFSVDENVLKFGGSISGGILMKNTKFVAQNIVLTIINSILSLFELKYWQSFEIKNNKSFVVFV